MLRNSLAHMVARVAALASGIVTIPLVALTLGPEALGLVGVYGTLQAMVALFDLGLPVAANHRLAVMIGRNAPPEEQAALVRTLESLFWFFAALFCVVGLGLSDALSRSWLNINVLSHTTVKTALALMFVTVAVRFPVTFYTNVLFAHDRHIFPNFIIAISAIVRLSVSLVALVWFHVGIIEFFAIQCAGSVVEVVMLVGGVWRTNPNRLIAPRWNVVREIRALAGGLTLISVTAVVLSQIDKVVVSKLLSLSDFGVYSAGYTLASGLIALSYPIGNAVFPQLSRSLDKKRGETAHIVCAATELSILALIPLGSVLIMQAQPVLWLLFLVKPVPDGLVEILPLMMLGGLAQALITLPHLFQVAAGRVATVVKINSIFVVPYGFLVLVSTMEFGVVGAAASFAVLNGLRLLIYWSVLLLNRTDRQVWLHGIFLALTTVASGLMLSAAAAAYRLPDATAALIAICSIAVLVLLAMVAMPLSRARLLAAYRKIVAIR